MLLFSSGWVCYAEKSHGKLVLPYMSAVKSPQGVMGTLVKRRLAAEHGVRPQDVLHVTVMPCFDKKLEASRGELTEPVRKAVVCLLRFRSMDRVLISFFFFLFSLSSTGNPRARDGLGAV